MQVLVTRRLTLRPPAMLDAEEIALWLNNWQVARMLGPVPFPYHCDDARTWIAGLAEKPEGLVYTIHRERLIGVVSVEGGGPEPRLGYWLAEPWHGRGFMTEAAHALIAHAFATTQAEAILSSVFVDNPRSLRTQEKLGFSITGTGTIFSRPRGETVRSITTRLTAEAFVAARPALARTAA